MHKNLVIRNDFCDIEKVRFRKWDEIDVLFWKFGRNNSQKKAEYII